MQFKGYRTIGFNLLLALIPIMEASGITQYLTDKQMLWYTIALIVGNLILRVWYTDTKVGSK